MSTTTPGSTIASVSVCAPAGTLPSCTTPVSVASRTPRAHAGSSTSRVTLSVRKGPPSSATRRFRPAPARIGKTGTRLTERRSAPPRASTTSYSSRGRCASGTSGETLAAVTGYATTASPFRPRLGTTSHDAPATVNAREKCSASTAITRSSPAARAVLAEPASGVRRSAVVGLDATIAADGNTGGTARNERHIPSAGSTDMMCRHFPPAISSL